VEQPEVMVRMGELATGARDATALVSIGLGSCIGLALLDRDRGIAGLAHVMLPVAPAQGDGGTPGRFADQAVPALLAELTRLGARRARLGAVLVGGARMFSTGSTLDIGSRNEAAARDALASARIPVLAADTSGSTGRTIRVRCADGVVSVKAAGGQQVQLFPSQPMTGGRHVR
jgi:chemotaxis protein CheD